jgi:hypothetical protein
MAIDLMVHSTKSIPKSLKIMMMKKKNVILSLCAIMIAFSACSPDLRPFTSSMLKEGGWGDGELKKIQFYLSDDLIIQRQLTEGSSEITSGKIKIVRGEKLEEIRIPRGTPGVFLFKAKENNFAVSFDATSDKRFLMFGPNPKLSGRYVLLASEWQSRQGKVQYDSKSYYTTEGSALANLMVDFRKIRQREVQSEVARGRKVNQ